MKKNRLARRSLLLLLSLLMLLGIFSTASAEESTNLLQNPGFEEIGADGLPVGWKTDAYLNLEGVTFYTVSDNAMSGAHSVQIENLDHNDARFCQTVAVEPSSFYRLSGYVKAWDTLDEGLGGNLSIKDVYVFSESVYDSPDEWQYVELYGVTDTDQHEVTVYARLGGYSGESFGTAMFDDLSLVKVDAPPEGIVASRWYQPTAAVQDDPQPGFLFVREGEGYLSTLTLYDGVRKVADQDSGLFSVSEFSDRFSENSGLTSWARFSPMLTAEMRERRHSDLLSSALPLLRVGEAALPLERHYADSGVTLKDLWRSLPNDLPQIVEANAAMTFDCLPHDAAPQRVYLVALSLDDGSDEGAARACRECLADLVKAPSEPGCYAVLLDCGDVLFHALFKIA